MFKVILFTYMLSVDKFANLLLLNLVMETIGTCFSFRFSAKFKPIDDSPDKETIKTKSSLVIPAVETITSS